MIETLKSIIHKNALRKYRQNFRESLKEQPAFTPQQYKERIGVHRDTLDKYMSQFGYYIQFYAPLKSKNRKKLDKLIGKKRVKEISEGSPVTINEVFDIFEAFNLKREFTHYLVEKTHFSYSLYRNQKIKPAFSTDRRLMRKHPGYIKFAEFVYIIMCEYICLHNYMWSGRVKPKSVRSIDRFLREIK